MITIIQENTFEKARKAIKKAKPPIIFSSNNDELNRKILERFGKNSSSTSSKLGQSKEKIDILLINQSHRKDWQKQRNSGLDQVMAKEAKKGNVTIAINLDEILDVKEKQKAEILARIKQNIKLCNKVKVKMTFMSQKYKKDVYDLKALGLVLGMPTWMLIFKEFN